MSTTKPLSGKSRDEIAKAYSSPPFWYDLRGFFILTFSYNSTIPAQIRHFGRNFGPEHLEIAVGSGTLLNIILRWRRWMKLPPVKIVGIDYAESMLAGAIHRFSGKPDIELQLADAANLPFPDNQFNTINIANALHCLPELQSSLHEMLRVLEPNGTLAANVLLYPRGPQPFKWIAERINRWGIRKGILFTPYEQSDIKQQFLDAGFELVNEETSGNCYNILARKPG